MKTFFCLFVATDDYNDSLIHQKFLILKFCHKYQETPHLAFTCSSSTLETSEQYVEYVQS